MNVFDGSDAICYQFITEDLPAKDRPPLDGSEGRHNLINRRIKSDRLVSEGCRTRARALRDADLPDTRYARTDMEVAGEGRNFRLVPEEDLPAIQEFLSSFLPYSLKFHQTIVTYLRDRVWEFHFYVAKSWPEDPIILHFPGQTCTPLGLVNESFTVFCPPERMDTLELLRTEDVLIDWSRTFFLNFTHSEIIETIALWPCVRRVERTHCDIYVLKEPPPDDIQLGEMQGVDCEVRELKPEHASIIHNLYPAREMESVEVFRRLINKLPAYGVFSQGELAAWMMQSYYGAMFSMQTRPEFRRKGFGIHLAQALTKKVRSRGYIPFVMIRPENDASLGLYHKLGYVKSYSSTRAVFYVNDEASEKEANSTEEKEVEECKDEGDNETASERKDLEKDQGKGNGAE